MIEPLGVVDHADERSLLGGAGEQAEHRQPDEEAIGRVAGAQPERRAQRVALRAGKRVETFEQRRAQLMQSRERDLHLGLDAAGARDAASRRTLHDVLQKGRLADAGLPVQHERAALTAARRVHQPVERVAFASTAEQRRTITREPTRYRVPRSAGASSLRELTSSLANTLCRWYWTVRGLMNSLPPISGLERPSPASLAICASCGGEHVARLDRARAGGHAGRQQLACRALREGLHPDRHEQLVRDLQLLARVEPPALAAQPLAVEQMRTGQVDLDPGAPQALHGLAIRALGDLAVAQQRPRQRVADRAPSRCRRRASAPRVARSASRARSGWSLRVGRFDQLRQRPVGDGDLRGVRDDLLRRGQCGLVAAEAVVEDRARPGRDGQPLPLAACPRVVVDRRPSARRSRIPGPASRRARYRRTASARRPWRRRPSAARRSPSRRRRTRRRTGARRRECSERTGARRARRRRGPARRSAWPAARSLVVPDVVRGTAGEPEPADRVAARRRLGEIRAQRASHDRRPDRVAVGGQQRHPVQQQIRGRRGRRGRGRFACRPCHLREPGRARPGRPRTTPP